MYIYTSILFVNTFDTVTKIRYVTEDARLYTQGENKTDKAVQSSLRAKIHRILKK